MANESEDLVPVFVPALSAVLINREDKKGSPLTHDEVIEIRDQSACIMMYVDDVQKMVEARGYRDIDPENCWYDWQHLRRELGRKPDLDPGPKFNLIQSSDPEYQKTIQDAHATIDQFRGMLPADGTARFDAMIKTEVTEGDHRAFIWLSNTRAVGDNFIGEFFEISNVFKTFKVGDQFAVAEGSLLDWMVNDGGFLHGGFSIRYYRSTLPEEERQAYDEYIGVQGYS